MCRAVNEIFRTSIGCVELPMKSFHDTESRFDDKCKIFISQKCVGERMKLFHNTKTRSAGQCRNFTTQKHILPNNAKNSLSENTLGNAWNYFITENHVWTGYGIIPFEEITSVHAVEFFRLLKVCQFDVRNFSTTWKQANSTRGIIPFIESTYG